MCGTLLRPIQRTKRLHRADISYFASGVNRIADIDNRMSLDLKRMKNEKANRSQFWSTQALV